MTGANGDAASSKMDDGVVRDGDESIDDGQVVGAAIQLNADPGVVGVCPAAKPPAR